MIKRLPAALLAFMAFVPVQVEGQLDGMRVNWPLPKNFNILAVHRLSGTVNATLTNLPFIQPSLDIENELYLLTYSRSQPILGRSTVWTAVLPAGVIKTSSPLPVATNDPFVHGVGDPSLGVTINLVGAPALMLREYARYDLGTVVSLGVSGTFPLGQYDSLEPLNVGSNQYKVRFALPIVHSLGAWVPGGRTTIEVTPSLTWLTANNDSRGQTVDQDPLVAVEAHLTRDFTRNAAISADYSYIRFGESTATDNASGTVSGAVASADTHLFGATLNFTINDNLALFVTHMQTVSGEAPVALEGALSRVTLTWSFHRVIENRRNYVSGS
jgi:hypothetical protein